MCSTRTLSRGAALLGGIVLLCGSGCGGGGGRRSSTGVFSAKVRERRKETERHDVRPTALTPQADQDRQLTVDVGMKHGRQCWMFSHLAKSGGSTIKTIIRDRFGEKAMFYTNDDWLAGNNSAQNSAKKVLTGRRNIIAGGFTEALRPLVGDACKWFTVFRHPISRLVSAYFYCQKMPQDNPACGTSRVKAVDVDLMGFAKHWGNYALRQFALSLISVDDVLEYAVANGAGPMAGRWDDPGWYLVKMYLKHEEEKFDHNGDGESLPDRAMYDMLLPIQNLLKDHYAVVGILEEFDETLELFNRALEIPDLEWHSSFREIGIENADDTYHEQEKKALEAAWTNAELKQYMWLDILLYEQAVAIFLEKKKQYGI